MKTKCPRTLSGLAALTYLLAAATATAAPGGQFPARGNDTTQSLGQFRILVNPVFQGMMAGYPGYDSTTKRLTGPLLFDSSTTIGRSNPLLEGSASDGTGVPVGTAGTMVGDNNFTVQPGNLGPLNTREVHTEIRRLDLVGGGAAVRAGTNAPSQPKSFGEVQSQSGASLNPNVDFPAQSFFDIFVEVDLPAGGSFPGATKMTNPVPLLVVNTNLTSFPPKVIYVHGMSTAVPIMFSSDNPPAWHAGDVFGVLLLAGHGVSQTNDPTTQSNFLNTVSALPEKPVEPGQSNWGPSLTMVSSNSVFPNQGDDVTTSLGTFRMAVNPVFQSFMSGYPGWNSSTLRLTSPLLFDPATKIGRSSPLTDGSTNDISGVLVGSAGTLIAESNFTLIPFSGPAGTREVHTELRSLNLQGGGAVVQAGHAFPPVPICPGEVESLSGNSGDPYWDFPAKSFFDIFVDVTIPAGGSFPGALVTNGQPMIVENSGLTAFPPKVIYTHGNTTAVPVLFATNVPAIGAHAGDTFGILLLAGHGVGYSMTNTNDVLQFQQAVSQLPDAPVQPQYSNWAPNLTMQPGTTPITVFCSSNIIVAATSSNGATVFYNVNASNGCSPPTLNFSQPSGSVFPIGSTTVFVSASDNCGDTANCAFSVTVTDAPIALTCSTNITVTTTNTNGAVVFYNASASGGCSPPIIVGNPPSGSTFSNGTTIVQVTATDSCGGSNSCTFSVTVNHQSTAITLTCPTNITTTATSSNGAVVNYTAMASGGCSPPPFVSGNPASGSDFPVGTTIVHVTATDTCGDSNFCSFSVTVNPQAQTNGLPPPGYWSPTNTLPPTNTVYISPAQWHALYANGIVIRDVRHRRFTQSVPPPPLGASNSEFFSSEVDFNYSTDNGNTYQPGTGTASVTVGVTHDSDSGPTNHFNTQMTQLDLTGPGFMVRVSPTLPSTGQTTVSPSEGGFMVSSFFDIFTEISLDGGATWTPQQGQPGHMEMRPDPLQAPTTPEPTPLLPPPVDHYVSPGQWHALFANGIVLTNVEHKFFTSSFLPPTSGGSNVESFGSVLNLQISTDGGNSFQFVHIPNAPVQVTVVNNGSSGNAIYDTEMTSLSFTTPSGVMIRTSPTLPSRGVTEVDQQADGTYQISSFFDIFTEVSLDGGATWSPSTNGPVQMELSPQASEQPPISSGNLPPTNGQYISPAQWHALYANGIIITNVIHRAFTRSFPLPNPGSNSVETLGSVVDGMISMDGGGSFQPFSAPAAVGIQVNSRPDLDNGSTRYFDTQMTQLDLSGGTLPPGVQVRQSPSIPTQGVTSDRNDGSGGFHVSSFFDVFTEISLDGGNTWSPTTTPPGGMSYGGNETNSSQPITLTCPTNITVTTSSNSAVVNFTATASGGCSPPPTVIANPASGSDFPLGTTLVTVTASDNCGDSNVCSFDVTVNEQTNTPIVITCPSDITTNATSPSGATVFFTVNASGGCSPPPFVVANPPSGSTFPVGVTTVYASATDSCGGSNFCSFTITVNAQTNPPISIICPPNITTNATSQSGAVVFFTVNASGGCSPPPNVVASPPSGSTFPIGTTQVFATASDTCGDSTNCSFFVTINGQTNTTTSPPPTYYNHTNTLPPTNTVYISPRQWHVLFNNGIVIRNIRHHFFTQGYQLPPLGGTTNEHFGSQLDYDLSTDGGATFNPATGTAQVTVQVMHSGDTNGTSYLNTEMTQLDLTGPGFMLRASPTLQSTGQTTVQPVTGGYMISSFFDIFTEISLDGGTTWTPAEGPGHVEMRPDPAQPGTSAVGEPTPLLPPPVDAYVSPATWHALFAQGIVITNVSHKRFIGSQLPPPPGATNLESIGSILDMQISTDGGHTFQFVRVTNVPVTVQVANNGGTNNGLYDTQMTSLLANIPVGPSNIQVRASQSLPSQGETQITPQADGTFQITSFFDIFTEISLDGGNTWSPATNGPVRMQLTPLAPEVPSTGGNLPVTNRPYISPRQWHALYNSGVYISNVTHRAFTANYPPPPPGGTNVETFGSMVDGMISLNGGATFQPFTAPASVQVQVSSMSNLDNGGTRYFDTQMQQLNLSGGNLPGGVMVRASQSQASLGRTSVRTNSSGYHVSSFFDVFTEVSVDGGNTWSPSPAPGPMAPVTNCIVSIACPSSITVTSVGPAIVNYTVTASDTCGNPLTVNVSPPSGSSFAVGTTTPVVATAGNADGTNMCTFTVTVVDRQRVFPTGGKLPPTNSLYVSIAQWHAAYGAGIYISNVVHRRFTANFPPPASGTTSNESFNSLVDFSYSTDGGVTFQKYTGNAACTVKVTNTGASGSNQVYQTQMTQLDLSGGSMPSNMRLRVDPSTPSTGQTIISPTGNGDYQISSYFDIFTDLSLDGGSTWTPSSSSGHMELHIDAANPPTLLEQPHASGSQLTFNMTTVVGLRYTVQHNKVLNGASGTWTTLTVISGNGQPLLVTDPSYPQDPIRFYRVIIDEDPNQ